MTAVTTDDLPADVAALIDQEQYVEVADFPVERSYIWTACASVENGNPLFWDDEVATDVTGGPIAPPSMLSTWFRPHHWAPGREKQALPLQVHFDLKDRLGLAEAHTWQNTTTLHGHVGPGDMLTTQQRIRSRPAYNSAPPRPGRGPGLDGK